MKNVTWILQRNMASDYHRWVPALEACDSAYRHIDIIPFSDDLPDVSFVTDFVVCNGSTSLIKNVHKKNWKPGIFFNPDNFRPSVWKVKYGPNFLNYGGSAMKLGEVSIPGIANRNGLTFVRPNGDFKDFSGSIVTYESWEAFVNSVKEGGYMFDDQLEVFAAPVKDVVEEYRVFIVDGVAVSASKYKVRTILDKKPGAPEEVMAFANKMAAIWSPEKAYVMDICRTVEDEVKIIELNCFNASGVYAAPLEPVIKAVEEFFP